MIYNGRILLDMNNRNAAIKVYADCKKCNRHFSTMNETIFIIESSWKCRYKFIYRISLI